MYKFRFTVPFKKKVLHTICLKISVTHTVLVYEYLKFCCLTKTYCISCQKGLAYTVHKTIVVEKEEFLITVEFYQLELL